MGGEGEPRGVPQGPLQPRAYCELRRRDGGSAVALAAVGRQRGGGGRRRSGGNAGCVAFELPYAVVPASGPPRRLRRPNLRRSGRRRDRRNRAGATGDDQGEASPENRVGGRRAFEGGARSPASPGPRNLLHRQFGEDAGYRGVGGLGLRVHGARTTPAMARSKPGSPAVALCFWVRWAAVLPPSRFRQPRLCVTPDTEPNLDRPSRGASLPKSRARASPRRFRLR